MRDFHAGAVRIWPFTGTCPHGGSHWDRALASRGEGPSTKMGPDPAASPQPLEVEAVAKGGGPPARMGPGSSFPPQCACSR